MIAKGQAGPGLAQLGAGTWFWGPKRHTLVRCARQARAAAPCLNLADVLGASSTSGAPAGPWAALLLAARLANMRIRDGAALAPTGASRLAHIRGSLRAYRMSSIVCWQPGPVIWGCRPKAGRS